MLRIRSINRFASLDAGNELSLYDGSGVEFSGIREYDESDDARLIAWRASARGTKVYVKNFEATSALSLTLIIDTHIGIYFRRENERSKYDFLQALLDDIYESSINFWHRVSSYTRTRESEIEKISTKDIHTLFYAIDASLSESRCESGTIDLYLRKLIEDRTKNTLVILVTDTLTPPHPWLLNTLKAQNDIVCIHYFSTFEYHPDSLTLLQSDYTTGGIYKIESYKKEFMRKVEDVRLSFQKIGGYILLTTDDDEEEKLNRFFEKRKSI